MVEVAAVEYAQLATHQPHVVDDAGRGGFAQAELVPIRRVFAHELHERIHHERVMLGRHAEHAPDMAAALVFLLQHVRLLHNLAGICKEARALLRQFHAAARAREDGDSHLRFQFRYGLRQAGLCDEQLLGCGTDGAGFGYLYQIAELYECHRFFLSTSVDVVQPDEQRAQFRLRLHLPPMERYRQYHVLPCPAGDGEHLSDGLCAARLAYAGVCCIP